MANSNGDALVVIEENLPDGGKERSEEKQNPL
jgi:hypothetical protein